MKFGLSEAKIASFDEITGTYKEIDPVQAIKETEVSVECGPLNKETEKTLFGSGSGEAALNAIQQEMIEEFNALYHNLYILMRLYNREFADIQLPHNLHLRITREQIESEISEDGRWLIWPQIEALRINGYTERRDYEAAVLHEFNKIELRTKFVMLAIAKKFKLAEIGCGLIDGQVVYNYKTEDLEHELSGDDDLTNEIRERVEKRFHCKLR